MAAYLSTNWDAYNEKTTVALPDETSIQQLPVDPGNPDVLGDGVADRSAEDGGLTGIRLERSRNDSQQMAAWQEAAAAAVLPEADEGQKAETSTTDYRAKLVAYQERLARQAEAEQLIRLLGFRDALVYDYGAEVLVFVQEDRLDGEDVRRIAEVVMTVTGADEEGIRVSLYRSGAGLPVH